MFLYRHVHLQVAYYRDTFTTKYIIVLSFFRLHNHIYIYIQGKFVVLDASVFLTSGRFVREMGQIYRLRKKKTLRIRNKNTLYTYICKYTLFFEKFGSF